MQRTRDGGAEIVKYLKTGSAFYAPCSRDGDDGGDFEGQEKILPCAAYLEGEYGISGYFIGVPCKLGAA